MKLGSALTLISLSALMLAVAPGCGSEDEQNGGGTQTGTVPPGEEGDPTASSEERTFAVHSLFLGETDRAGNKSKDAWKQFGYNLDGLVTNVSGSASPDLEKVCKRATGADAKVHQDGEGGIDNAFGSQIIPLLDMFSVTSNMVSQNIQAGDFTVMLKVKGLTDDPEQTNTGLSGTILVGGAYGEGTPKFTTEDSWPYMADPQVPITGAYINKGMFVNGTDGGKITLAITVAEQTLSLTINKAIITFKHDPANKELVQGTIAGVIPTEELINGITSVAGRFNKDMCPGKPTLQVALDSIRQASDILANATQDPAKECDGISVGLGFTAKQIGAPTQEAPVPVAGPDPCTEGGGEGENNEENDE